MLLLWTPRASESRHAAIEYIAQENPKAALDQLDEIEEQTGMLLQHPEIGRAGRKQGTRELIVARTHFVVVYRIKAKRIEILHVLHSSQKWPAP